MQKTNASPLLETCRPLLTNYILLNLENNLLNLDFGFPSYDYTNSGKNLDNTSFAIIQ
jgi:hypothetical protein